VTGTDPNSEQHERHYLLIEQMKDYPLGD